MRIEYRTIEGELIEYTIDGDVTVSHINDIACRYLEKTYRDPEAIFMDAYLYAEFCKKNSNSYTPILHHSLRDSNIRLRLSVGDLPVYPIPYSYTPVFVGSRVEFDDNNINKIFEEVVLKDFDRV